MTRKEISQARNLVEALLRCTRNGSEAHVAAIKLDKLLQEPPTMEDIILSVPAESHRSRAKVIGISRQGYYNLIQGVSRPNSITAKRLADLTGVSEEIIRQAGA